MSKKNQLSLFKEQPLPFEFISKKQKKRYLKEKRVLRTFKDDLEFYERMFDLSGYQK